MSKTTSAEPSLRDYKLNDNLWATNGTVFLTGTQALVRLMLMQRQRDASRNWHTQGFVSGYRGSPLGMVDQAIWRAGGKFSDAGIRFSPAINEELAATQVLGTQRVEADPQRQVDGVFALWYGKGPGVDRAGDALKHGNAYGSSPHGGVVVVAGDDHGCVSSSMPHQSDHAFMGWSMPIVQPANVAELLEFGLYAYELSRFSGAWVGMPALSEVVESGLTVDLDAVNAQASQWVSAQEVSALTQHQAPSTGLHNRWPDLPSLEIESRLAEKIRAILAFAQVNRIDRHIIESDQATVGIITCGKAHFDLMEVLRRLNISTASLAQAGVRLYKVGLSFPLEPSRIKDFAKGLREILVIEEKGAIVETQLRELFYNAPADARPALIGKLDRQGKPLVSSIGELRPSRLIEIVGAWLAEHFPENKAFDQYLPQVCEFTPIVLAPSAADSVKRLPYFCAGCPHNTSTKVPEGSTARAGIGCHFMANWMDRSTVGLVQMGGEGVDWVSHAMFTKTPHVFQNLGDGTYYHSGYLAIRQAVAAKATITYKILFNDAVAMTGGQPVDGVTSVDRIARQVESEGVQRIAVVSDDIQKYAAIKKDFPSSTQFYDRSELDTVQRQLRDIAGVTVLIYEQTCASEKRRRRKKGELDDPPKRILINEAVCEGCGDCTVQSNCVAVLPIETAMGRKRKIDQTACNKDYSCAQGFCPSFVSVTGGATRKGSGSLAKDKVGFSNAVNALPLPSPHKWAGPWDLLVTGVGGTGVVTVGAVIAMAAHLEGKAASVLDFMGFAQKGGSVLSFVRLAQAADSLNQVRIDTQQADAILACDMVVAASPEALQTARYDRTRVVINVHEIPVAESLKNPDADLKADLLVDKVRAAAGSQQVETLDAQALSEEFIGDTVTANIVAMGYAWQRGLIPISLAAMQRAIELNGVAIEKNLVSFSLGRLAAGNAAALRPVKKKSFADETTSELIKRGSAHLASYQNKQWAEQFEALVQQVQRAEQSCLGHDDQLPLTRAVARSLLKLMSYKDEYEVARLYSDGSFERQVSEQFEGQPKLEIYLAPPLLSRSKNGQPPKKMIFGPWVFPLFKLLAKGKALRGTRFDLFGYTHERRMERELISSFIRRITEITANLKQENLSIATQIAAVPLSIRGFGHVKIANVALARAREAELLHRFLPEQYAKPIAKPSADQFRGIKVVSK
jgi:indolepyruvate ferredoxin oxidoreductase